MHHDLDPAEGLVRDGGAAHDGLIGVAEARAWIATVRERAGHDERLVPLTVMVVDTAPLEALGWRRSGPHGEWDETVFDPPVLPGGVRAVAALAEDFYDLAFWFVDGTRATYRGALITPQTGENVSLHATPAPSPRE